MINIPHDKLLHYIAGTIIYGLCSLFIGLYAIVIVLVVAIGKEVYDHYYGGTVDVYDIIATVSGGLVCIF